MTAKEYFEKTHPINIGVVTNDDCIKTMNDYLDNCLTNLIKLNKPCVSNRLSAVEMAEWFHNNYEEISKETGWETQDKCKVDFKDLPVKNKETMIKVCQRWLNGC